MTRYLVMERASKEAAVVEAASAQEACESLGWMIGNCYVQQVQVIEQEQEEDAERETQDE
jgi:hypothetical protein